ncbi:MAG: tetratricopeptide repeat protein, partial [Anaerolineae bacterium]
GLRARYARTGQLADLAEAIRVYEQALQATPPNSPDLPGYLNNLGNGLRARYARTGHPWDLEEAILVTQQAVARTPPDSPDLPSTLHNLGIGLRARYAGTGRLEDLEEALKVNQQAVQLTPPDSPDLSRYLLEQGDALAEKYVLVEDLDSLEPAISCYEQATFLSLTLAPYILQEVARRTLGTTKQLIVHGKVTDALSLTTRLQALTAQQIPKRGDALTRPKPETIALIREATVTYQTSPDHAFLHEQPLGLLRDVLSIVSSVASALLESSASSAYATALQALELARQNDKRTGEALKLAQWVRNMSGFEFVELENADDWPPRVAYLVHLAARYERDENWDAAIDAYTQACELLDQPKSEGQFARSTEIGFRLALCLKQAGRWSEALKQQEENIARYKKLDDLQGKANAYMEMGHIYHMMNLHDPALLYYGEAYYLYRQVADNTADETVRRTARHGMANAKESRGNLEFQLTVLPKGVTDLEEARQLYLDLGMPGKAAIISQTLEDVQVKQGDQHA